jgi:hypothetical protein
LFERPFPILVTNGYELAPLIELGPPGQRTRAELPDASEYLSIACFPSRGI